MWSKRRILEVYMNAVEFGAKFYGVEAAAQFYYGKSSKSLNREQAAFLAALLPNQNIIRIIGMTENFST